MKPETRTLLQKAQEARSLYLYGKITRGQARALCEPYIEAFNDKSKEIARKYGQRPKFISFSTFVR